MLGAVAPRLCLLLRQVCQLLRLVFMAGTTVCTHHWAQGSGSTIWVGQLRLADVSAPAADCEHKGVCNGEPYGGSGCMQRHCTRYACHSMMHT